MKRVYEIKDGAIVYVEVISAYIQDLQVQTNGNLPDLRILDYYIPCCLSIGEVEGDDEYYLPSHVFIEIINGRLIAYRQLRHDNFEVFATEEEVANNPTIRDGVEEYLEMVFNYDYEIVEIKREKFIRVICEGTYPDTRNVLYSKKIQEMLLERFDGSAYLIQSVRGTLILFSTKKNVAKTVLKVVNYYKGLLREDIFGVFLITMSDSILAFSDVFISNEYMHTEFSWLYHH